MNGWIKQLALRHSDDKPPSILPQVIQVPSAAGLVLELTSVSVLEYSLTLSTAMILDSKSDIIRIIQFKAKVI